MKCITEMDEWWTMFQCRSMSPRCVSVAPVVIQLEPNMHSDTRGQGEFNQSRELNNLPFQAAISF